MSNTSTTKYPRLSFRRHSGSTRGKSAGKTRDRIKAGKRVRTRPRRWAFRRLRDFVAYQAEALGLSVVYVNSAYTSKTCSICGAIGKREHGWRTDGAP